MPFLYHPLSRRAGDVQPAAAHPARARTGRGARAGGGLAWRVTGQLVLAVAWVLALGGVPALALGARAAGAQERAPRDRAEREAWRRAHKRDVDRLRGQIARLQAAKDRLATSGDQARAALDEARREADALAVLAGTVPATGPGVVLSVADPDGRLDADTMLDTVEELRDAGAEAIEIGRPGRAVRVVASTWFGDGGPGVVEVDGVRVSAPYRVVAIGDPPTLAAAMRIPGGVVDTVTRAGGSVDVQTAPTVQVTALRPLDAARYARPAPGATGDAGP